MSGRLRGRANEGDIGRRSGRETRGEKAKGRITSLRNKAEDDERVALL